MNKKLHLFLFCLLLIIIIYLCKDKISNIVVRGLGAVNTNTMIEQLSEWINQMEIHLLKEENIVPKE